MVALTPITPDLGVEIRGISLDSALAENIALLRRALVKHHLLVVRARILKPEEQIAFARIFGVPELWPNEPSQLPGFPCNLPGREHTRRWLSEHRPLLACGRHVSAGERDRDLDLACD